MSDREYVQTFLDTNGNKIKDYVDYIRSTNDEKGRQYIFSSVIKMMEYVQDILIKAGVKDIPINIFFNELYLLKDNEIINKFLNKYNYEKKIQKSYQKAFSNINKRIIPKGEEEKTMCFLIENDLLLKHEMEIYEFYLKYTLLNEKPTDLETLKTIIIKYTKNLMKQYVEDPKVHIIKRDMMKEKRGYSYQNQMWLCEDDVRRMIKYGDFSIIDTIFHELMHVSQYSDVMIKKEYSERVLTIIKDEILSHLVKNYYINNHIVMLAEVEANIYSRKMILDFFKRNNLEFKDGYDKYHHAIENYEKVLNYSRRVNGEGEVESLDLLFDSIVIHHPEYLDIYEQLNENYKIDFGDYVIRKDDFTGGQR